MAGLKTFLRFILECVFVIPFLFFSCLARISRKPIDVGIGPEPILSHAYHKMALIRRGFSAETFVNNTYCISTEFDYRADKVLWRPFAAFRLYWLFLRAIFRYRCLYIYFNGGPLGFTIFLWKLEPFFYRLANVKIVLLAYGSDVQEMSRSPNLYFKHAMSIDYPTHRFSRSKIGKKIDLWTKKGSHIVGGCEWVDYMYHWDTLMLTHFAIDTDKWKPDTNKSTIRKPIRILHAPNHRTIKGTQHFLDAVDSLKREGFDVELVIMERVPNHEVMRVMESVDLVADQLVIGWYAMFAMEAMALEKPVLCYLREDLVQFYQNAGLIERDEIPILQCTPQTVLDVIRDILLHPEKIPAIGKKSREFLLKHHSIENIGKKLEIINKSIGLMPRK